MNGGVEATPNDDTTSIRSHQTMVTCTRRRHATAAPLRQECAEGPSKSINFRCTNCGKDLIGCRECARNNRIEQWAYRDTDHLRKDHSKKRGCGRSGSSKAPRTSMRNQPKSISSPRLSILHRLSARHAYDAVQLVPGFIPSLHVGHAIPMGSALNELGSVYDGANGEPIPEAVSGRELGKYVGSKIATQFVETLSDSGFALEEGKSMNIFRSGEGRSVNYTSTHSDGSTVVMVVLYGRKTVWVGGREVSTGPFLDNTGRRWVSLSEKDDSTTSHFWDLANEDQNSEDEGTLEFVHKMKAFRRATIGPGDALLIPRRFLHAATTAPRTASMSAIVKVKR